MHVKSLKLFCDIVGRRSFSRAADENGMSQSGASQMMHHLEERLGVKLIDRSKRPLVLTPEGEVYYRGCRKLVQRYYALEEDVRNFQKEEVAGRVSVASIYSVGLSHMDQFVKRFVEAYPRANVRVEYQHPDEVVRRVEKEHVDLGLISYPKPTRQLDVTPWREEPLVLVCSPQHPLASRESVSLGDLGGLKLVAFDSGLRIRRAIDRELASCHVDVEVALEFDNIESIKRAVEIDAGVSLLPEPTITRERETGSLRVIAMSGESLSRPLGIIHRRGHVLTETARRFVELLQADVGALSVSDGGKAAGCTSAACSGDQRQTEAAADTKNTTKNGANAAGGGARCGANGASRNSVGGNGLVENDTKE